MDTAIGSTAYAGAVAAVRAGASATEEASRLHDLLTPDEQLGLLDGDEEFWKGMAAFRSEGYNRRPIHLGTVERLGIPGFRFSDGPRGVVIGNSTAFPVSMARGASWDVDLEERIGRAIGAEVAAQGGNLFAGVCINLPRHPAWGRAQETYGEDPHLLGEFGAALTRGVREHVMACVKHFALNSMENARFTVDVRAADHALHEVYLPHFRRTIEAGADGVMSAYNKVNGEWAGHSRVLLTDILRERWGFEGVVVSDFIFGLRDAAASLEAGLDIEAPFRQQRAMHLADALVTGAASWASVRRSGVRAIATQLRFDATHGGPTPPSSVVAGPEHRALAREAAARAMVLLRNQPVGGRPLLPLDGGALRRVAVIGRLADLPNLGDHGSSDVRAPDVVTPLEGLQAALPHVEFVVVTGDDPEAAAAAARSCDVAVVVAGFTAEDEGEYVDPDKFANPVLAALCPPLPEAAGGNATITVAGLNSMGVGGDRERLTLRPLDEDIIRAVALGNPRTVVAIVAAGAVIMESWRQQVPALLMSWYAGMQGGHALADVLLGRIDASGRLPFSIPTDEAHLPSFDRDATSIDYDLWHGQRLLDRLGVAAAYPLGFGRSYTSWTIASAWAERVGEDSAVLTARVVNTGDRRGRHVVQVYGRFAEDEVRKLVGFACIELDAASAATVSVPLSLRPVMRWDGAADDLRLPAGELLLEAGAHSGDAESAPCVLPLP